MERCSVCVSFAEAAGLAEHVALHEEEERACGKRRKVECDCGRAFDGELELGLHRQYEHEVPPMAAAQCPQCGERLAGDEALALHLSVCQAGSPTRPPALEAADPEDQSFVLLGRVRGELGRADVAWGGADDTRLFFGRERWGSCGYRNLQSLLAAAGLPVPDVEGVQRLLCAAWEAGHDPRAARQLGGAALLGSRVWIGACETLTVLRWRGRRAFVHEFARRAGRAPDAAPLRAFVRDWFATAGAAPLQLQWRGHSVLAVGGAPDAAALWDPNAARVRLRPWRELAALAPLQVLALLPGPEPHPARARDPDYMARRAYL